MLDEIELIKYMESLGLKINTSTKARGHQGFFLDGRIDISKQTPKDKVIPTLLHEFAHYIHSKLEYNITKTGGSLNVLFDDCLNYEKELIDVTHFVDKNSKCEKLYQHKEIVKKSIKKLDNLIKIDYPKFQRSKKFKEFDRAVRYSKVKYLLKYDRVRIMPLFFFGKEEILSIKTIEQDFPNLKLAFVNYIKLQSLLRKQKRITNRISKLNRYYNRPTELFARLVEALYIDKETTCSIAPCVTSRFFELLNNGYYNELKFIFEKI